MRIKGWVTNGDESHVSVDGVELSLEASLKVANHSPAGFAWGYHGSGPAQTALAIMLHVTRSKETAQRLYQLFKSEFVSHWPLNDDFEVDLNVLEWLVARL